MVICMLEITTYTGLLVMAEEETLQGDILMDCWQMTSLDGGEYGEVDANTWTKETS